MSRMRPPGSVKQPHPPHTHLRIPWGLLPSHRPIPSLAPTQAASSHPPQPTPARTLGYFRHTHPIPSLARTPGRFRRGGEDVDVGWALVAARLGTTTSRMTFFMNPQNARGEWARLWTLTNTLAIPPGADQSAVGANESAPTRLRLR